MIKIRTKK